MRLRLGEVRIPGGWWFVPRPALLSDDVLTIHKTNPKLGTLNSELELETRNLIHTRNLIWKPTREQILAAEGKTVRDVIGPDLRVLFCGINPGLYTAAVGHHFARPGNRFWKALYDAGFTDHLISPFDERQLLKDGYGVTNVVARATAAADALTREEIIEGGRRLARKVRRYRPRVLAVLGVGAYRTAFNQSRAVVGRQELTVGNTIVWVLPNPSGLNANYQQKDLARLFRELKATVSRT